MREAYETEHGIELSKDLKSKSLSYTKGGNEGKLSWIPQL